MGNPPSDPRPPVPAGQHAVPATHAPTVDMREAVVTRLSDAFAYDVLPLEEFERRVGEAYRVASPAALAALVQDLPADAAGEHSGATHALAPAEPMAVRIGALFSNVERAGRLAVPPRLSLRSLFGNIELDLREAEFGPGVTEISVDAIFGNVEVRLPAHVSVENHGDSVIGSFVVRGSSGRDQLVVRSAATVRITGRALLSNVEFDSGAGEKR